MSLWGYKKKTKPAAWTTMPNAVAGTAADLERKKAVRAVREREKRERSIARSRGTQKQRKPVRRVSRKKAAEDRVYSRDRVPFLQENPYCARCGQPATCVHHWAGRRDNYLKKETWRASCHGCNMYAKDHPKEAREEDWIAPIGVYRV